MTKKRALALLLVLLIAVAMVSSALYLAAEADHDCIGEDCPICEQISVCVQTLELLALAVFAAAGAIRMGTAVGTTGDADVSTDRRDTLVSCKVKLTC